MPMNPELRDLLGSKLKDLGWQLEAATQTL